MIKKGAAGGQEQELTTIVMPGLDPGIHRSSNDDGLPGHRRAEATPFFERLCPATTG